MTPLLMTTRTTRMRMMLMTMTMMRKMTKTISSSLELMRLQFPSNVSKHDGMRCDNNNGSENPGGAVELKFRFHCLYIMAIMGTPSSN